MNPRSPLRFVLPVLFFAGWCAALRSEESTNPKIFIRSLLQLEGQLRSASDAQSQAKISRSVLDLGAPLLNGDMRLAAAESVG